MKIQIMTAEEQHRTRFNAVLMDMNVFRPRKAKTFGSKKEYRRKDKKNDRLFAD